MKVVPRLLASSCAFGLSLVALVALVAACGEDAVVAPAETPDAGSAQDAGTPVVPDAAPATPPDPTLAERCEIELPKTRACYTGPAETRGKGRCKDGELTCTSRGVAICVGEVLPAPAEACNELDDDCDGVVDEDACVPDAETSCANGIDDDGDGATDCDDPSCAGLACGPGCVCAFASSKHETTCDDALDNDDDGDVDCADADCAAKICGVGCVCDGGARHETVCDDGEDNDGDGKTDCADADCGGKACGAGCVCAGLAKKEASCNDGVDNDGDGVADCADVADCPMGTVCRRPNGTPGTCQANRTCG